MSDFFKREDCDIRVSDFSETGSSPYALSITKANELLRERGLKVYGRRDSRWWDDHEPGLCDDAAEKVITQGPKTHTALLVCVEPIEKDSAEKILRDLIETAESLNAGNNPMLTVGYYVDRAKKLLEKK